MAIGTAWCSEDDVNIPEILHQVMAKHCDGTAQMGDIPIDTVPDDPSAVRDITDPIYHPCWWRMSMMIEDVTGIDLLGLSFNQPGPIADDVSVSNNIECQGSQCLAIGDDLCCGGCYPEQSRPRLEAIHEERHERHIGGDQGAAGCCSRVEEN
jgi:hypothetical protein